MSEALVDGRDGVVIGTDSDPTAGAFAKIVSAPPYEPDAIAYAFDPKNDRAKQLAEALDRNEVSLDTTVTTRDGRRETIRLTEAESRDWLRGSVETRFAIGNRKIRERHVAIAVQAVRRCGDGQLVVSPEEESALREFGAVEDVKQLRETADGKPDGYTDAIVLRESVRAAIARTPLDMQLREDFFDAPLAGDASYGYMVAPSQREFLPRGGPAMEQQLISDVWDTLAKSRYAYVHDPLVRHGCHILADFVLGRGVSITCKHPATQRVVDEFVQREKLNDRLHPLAVSLSRDGELFERIFRLGDGRISVGELHPATIWEISTDAEDIRKVYLYWQRYQTRTQMFTTLLNTSVVKWIEREIPANDVIHIKVNASQWDVRGHSDIYPALGWAKRLRDYLDATVQKEQSAAAYQWHYSVKGGNADVQRITSAISGAPAPPGSSFVTNEGVDVAGVSSGANAASKEGGTYETLVNQIAIAFGLSKDYFGAASRNTRASALIATEPAAKRFEQRQGVIQSFIERLLREVIAEARKHGRLVAQKGEDVEVDETFRVVFPTIITADSGTRIDLLRKAEGMGAISHKRTSQEIAGELELDDYDYDDERAQITQEIGSDPAGMIMQDVAPVKRGLPDKTDVAFDPKMVPNPADGAPKPGEPTGGDPGNESPTSNAGRDAIRKDMAQGDKRGMQTAEQRLAEAADLLSAAGALVIRP